MLPEVGTTLSACRGTPGGYVAYCSSACLRGADWPAVRCGAGSMVVGAPATPAAYARRSALFLRSSSAWRCSSAARASASICSLLEASRSRRSFMMVVGGRMLARSACVTGTGPAVVRAPPLAARPLPARSAMGAFSSTGSGVNEYGTRMASSMTKWMAEAVRREMWSAG
jgi:hypothetical protein